MLFAICWSGGFAAYAAPTTLADIVFGSAEPCSAEAFLGTPLPSMARHYMGAPQAEHGSALQVSARKAFQQRLDAGGLAIDQKLAFRQFQWQHGQCKWAGYAGDGADVAVAMLDRVTGVCE